MENKWESEKENLKQLISLGISYEEIGRLYGCTGANIKKLAQKLGIELPSRRKINPKEHFNKKELELCTCLECNKLFIPKENSLGKYCSNKCHQDHKYREWVQRWKNGEETGLKGKYLIANPLRRYLLDKYQHKCSRCGWNETNPYTGNIPLEIEHIDGNYQNNSEENLTVLCPNCHSLTSTYKGANKGNGRKERNKYRIE